LEKLIRLLLATGFTILNARIPPAKINQITQVYTNRESDKLLYNNIIKRFKLIHGHFPQLSAFYTSILLLL